MIDWYKNAGNIDCISEAFSKIILKIYDSETSSDNLPTAKETDFICGGFSASAFLASSKSDKAVSAPRQSALFEILFMWGEHKFLNYFQ